MVTYLRSSDLHVWVIIRNMFTIDRKSLVNFTGSNVLRLQKPNHASDLTVGGV